MQDGVLLNDVRVVQQLHDVTEDLEQPVVLVAVHLTRKEAEAAGGLVEQRMSIRVVSLQPLSSLLS